MLQFLKRYWGVFNPDKMPETYRLRRPLHDDWPPGFRWIPRTWSAWFFPMGAFKIAGNRDPVWQLGQSGYPIALHASVKWEDGKWYLLTMEPIHTAGGWSIQACEMVSWLPPIPCYFTATYRRDNSNWLFSIGLKPDVTTGDWKWDFPELSNRNHLMDGEPLP